MPIPNCVCGLVELGDQTLVQLLAQGDSISDNIVFAVESCWINNLETFLKSRNLPPTTRSNPLKRIHKPHLIIS